MSNRFDFFETKIAGLYGLKRLVNRDARGEFQRLFCAEELRACGWSDPIAQVNQTHTKTKGSIRGMHMQLASYSEFKMVTCTRGEVFDVVLDLRAGSATFLTWVGEVLSAEDANGLVIPPGCAHGFQTLCDDVEMLYCHDRPYAPMHEFGVHAFDSRAKISWPIEVTEMSLKDSSFPFLDEGFNGVDYARTA